MLFALVVMAGVLLLVMVVNNRRQPSRLDCGRATDLSSWAFGGVDGGCGASSVRRRAGFEGVGGWVHRSRRHVKGGTKRRCSKN